MKTFVLSLYAITFVILGLSNQAWALGHENGNGGGAIVCRNSINEITSAEVLDLWEARALHTPLLNDARDRNEFLQTALARIRKNNPLFGERVAQALKEIENLRVFIPEGTKLVPPTDANPWLLPASCQLEGAAQYLSRVEGDRLFVNPLIFDKMAAIDQAALWLHEAIYKVLRETDGDENSLRTRQMVSIAFSTQELSALKFVSFSCHFELANDYSSYSFSLVAAIENKEINAWVLRTEKKWQFPTLPVRLKSSAEEEKHFLELMQLRADAHQPLLPLPSVISLKYQYDLQGRTLLFTPMLALKADPVSGPLYDFNLFLTPKQKATCVVE